MFFPTVKAVAPIFAVIFSVVILGEKHSTRTYISLVPIIVGILIATVTEIEFNLLGMLSALFSMMVLSLQNIYSKKLFKERKFDHLNLLYYTSLVSCTIIIPFWFLTDARAIYHWYTSNDDDRLKSIQKHTDDTLFHGTADSPTSSTEYLVFQLLADGLCNFGQSFAAFAFLFYVSPVSYSVANTTKRIVIIVSGLLTFHNPVTYTNVMGMCLAVSGVALYNKAKLDTMQASSSSPASSSSVLSSSSGSLKQQHQQQHHQHHQHQQRSALDSGDNPYNPTFNLGLLSVGTGNASSHNNHSHGHGHGHGHGHHHRLDSTSAAFANSLLTATPSSDLPITMLDRKEREWHWQQQQQQQQQSQQQQQQQQQYHSNGIASKKGTPNSKLSLNGSSAIPVS